MILRAFLPVFAAAALLATAAVQAQQAPQSEPEGPPPPYAIARLLNDFPVTLYTSPSCKDACDKARAALNQRSVPFSEYQVWNEETVKQLKTVSASGQVPVLVVGRLSATGFEQSQFDELLSSAGYPAAGSYPPRTQAAPPPPDAKPKPAATATPAPEPKLGPYDTSGLKGPEPKTGPYDTSGLKGRAPKTGPYGTPAESEAK